MTKLIAELNVQYRNEI